MQPFVLYNSEQRKKVEFVPRKEGHIDMYVCGMTVYDYCHIGHARVMVAFDYIIRFLRSQGWNVKYVRNITDIDDKIIKRANENGESIQALTDRFIQAMNEDAANSSKIIGTKPGCAASLPTTNFKMSSFMLALAWCNQKRFTSVGAI